MKKKIAIYVPNLKLGGAEKVAMNLANEFILKGFNVDLLLTNKDGVYFKQLSNQINIHILSGKRVSLDFFYLLKYLIKYKPDFLLGTLTHVNFIVIMAKFFTFTKTRFFISEHSLISQYNVLDKTKINNYLVKLLYRNADGIIAVSEEIKRDILDLTNLNLEIKVIPNPVINSEIDNVLENASENTNNRVDVADFFLYVGRLEKEKNILELVKAIAPILIEREEKFVIIGEGTLKEEIRMFILNKGLEDKIILLGYVELPYDYMYNAKLLILPSLFEGFGNVAVESLYCKTDVIISNTAIATINIIKEGTQVITFSPENSDSLKIAIETALLNPNEIDSTFFEQFKCSNVANCYIEYFQNGS